MLSVTIVLLGILLALNVLAWRLSEVADEIREIAKTLKERMLMP